MKMESIWQPGREDLQVVLQVFHSAEKTLTS